MYCSIFSGGLIDSWPVNHDVEYKQVQFIIIESDVVWIVYYKSGMEYVDSSLNNLIHDIITQYCNIKGFAGLTIQEYFNKIG